jgi:hypothetical protein
MPYVGQQSREELRPVLTHLKARLSRDNLNLGHLYDTLSEFIECLETNPGGRFDPEINRAVDALVSVGAKAGNLNYVISVFLWEEYLRFDFSYSKLDAACALLMRLMFVSRHHQGTLFCAASEIYTRLGRPYEDEKIKSNGDVFIR